MSHFCQYVDHELKTIDTIKGQHDQAVQQGRDSLATMSSTEHALKTEAADKKTKLEAEQARLQQFQSDLDSVQQRLQILPAKLTTATQRAAKEKSYGDQVKELEMYRAAKEKELGDLTRGVAFFRERLGMEFVSVDGELRISMKFIDPKNADRTFAFGVQLDADNEYQVTHLDSALAGVRQVVAVLLQRLNESNDFGAFVAALRVLCRFVCGVPLPLPMISA